MNITDSPFVKVNMGGKQGTMGVMRVDITSAHLKIRNAEQDLERKLSKGERNDLIIDNFPQWSHDYCRAAVKAITLEDERREASEDYAAWYYDV